MMTSSKISGFLLHLYRSIIVLISSANNPESRLYLWEVSSQRLVYQLEFKNALSLRISCAMKEKQIAFFGLTCTLTEFSKRFHTQRKKERDRKRNKFAVIII